MLHDIGRDIEEVALVLDRDQCALGAVVDWDLDVDLGNWRASGDFLLVRAGAAGELVGLTEADVGLWEIVLGLDYILNR